MDNNLFETLHYLAESGIEDAMNEFIKTLMESDDDDVTDKQADLAVKYLKTLADKGDYESLQSMGTLHYTGYRDILPQDYVLARDYYHKAAELSELKDNWALNNLGCCYYFGLGGDVDYKKAYSCFALSAMYGNPNAMYKLGDMYYYGKYVEKDCDASFYWYIKAKEQTAEVGAEHMGFISASISMRIGRALLFGEGTEIDLISALFELRTAQVLFYNQTLNYEDPSETQIPKVKKLIKVAERRIERLIGQAENKWEYSPRHYNQSGDEVKGVILKNDRGVIGDLHTILEPIKDYITNCNWLITNMEYGYNSNTQDPFSRDDEYVWMSGEDILEKIEQYGVYFIWSVFSGIPKSIPKETVLKYDMPYADGYTGFWENPISIQHPLAEIEIVPWDGMMLLLICKDSDVIEQFKNQHPLCEDLEQYNYED